MNRKLINLHYLLAAITLLQGVLIVASAEPETPAHPEKLLAALPGKVRKDGWILERSRAKTEAGIWLISRAERTLVRKIPLLDPKGAPTGKIEEHRIEISLIDSGRHPSITAAPLAWPPLDEDKIRRGVVDGRPTTMIFYEEKTMRLQTLIDDRLLLTVRFEGLGREEAEEWIETELDYAAIARVKGSGKTTLPSPLPVVIVDEIHPSKNRASAIHMATEEELASDREEDIRLLMEEGNSREEAETIVDGD